MAVTYLVVIDHGPRDRREPGERVQTYYDPFDDETEAQRFAAFAGSEIDPASVRPLAGPLGATLDYWGTVRDRQVAGQWPPRPGDAYTDREGETWVHHGLLDLLRRDGLVLDARAANEQYGPLTWIDPSRQMECPF